MSGLLTLPRLGETMEEGRIVAWLVAPGEAYRRGDAILEVETDKTVVEVPALADGALAEILAPEGAQVQVGDPLARLAGAAPDAAPPPAPKPVPAPQAAPTAPVAASPRPDTLRATPVARRLARQAGLDLQAIAGTGRRNRIERADVQRHLGSNRAQDFVLWGPETGVPVLLLHGFAGDHTLWSGIASGLARAGLRVLAPDLPGHGANPGDAARPEALANGLAARLADTFDGPVHVVAHSLGAVPAVALAEAGQARALTLIAPAGLGLRIDGAFVRGLAAARSAGETAHLLQRMTEAPVPLSAEALSTIADTLAQGRLTALADALVGAAGQTVSLRAALSRLADTLPVRIVAPHRDRILDWQDMVTVSPRIAVHHLPNAGHMALWDAPQEVLEILRTVAAD